MRPMLILKFYIHERYEAYLFCELQNQINANANKMQILYAHILVMFFYLLSCICCEPSYTESGGGGAVGNGISGSNSNSGSISNALSANHQNTLLQEAEAEARLANVDPSNYDKRVERYAFGLGRRAYTYTNGGLGGGNGVKRLPVYNFGLGKRARPYSFGLGKRSDYDDADQYENDYERNAAFNGAVYLDEKRSRPYSFGLGKREPVDDVDRRGYPNRYGFGLGRR